MIDDALLLLGYVLVTFLPLVFAIAAAVLAITRWRRHPKVSLLTLIAASFLAAEYFIGRGMAVDWMDAQYSRAIADLVVWTLVLIAIFGWRNRSELTKTNRN
jgi:hypothetical protein